MLGPPMSIFSIASSSVTPGFSIVLAKGYRLMQTRSMGLMSCAFHGGDVFGVIAQGKQAAVDFGMQGFHPAVHHLGESCDGRHVGDGQTQIAKNLAVPPVEINSTLNSL